VQTTYSNDGGIDIVTFYDRPIFYGKYTIQCKNWQGTVAAPEIRDLYGVVTD
jgi:restriction endonuclease Mrr